MHERDGRAVIGTSSTASDTSMDQLSLRRNTQNISFVALVERCEKVMAHAWMVRTFVKHSEEVEEFPELMGIVRAIFDVSLALESRRHDPARYLRMLRTKFDRLRRAADEFRRLAPEASSHTNFRQAVISMDACIEDLQSVLDTSSDLLRVAR